jgi:hypothetical protein
LETDPDLDDVEAKKSVADLEKERKQEAQKKAKIVRYQT